MAESSVIAIATEIIFTPMCARGREDAARQSAVDNPDSRGHGDGNNVTPRPVQGKEYGKL